MKRLAAAEADGTRAAAVPVMSRQSFLQSLPKVDLHAHINGSLPADVLQALLVEADGPVSGAAAGAGLVLDNKELLAIADPADRMAATFKVFDAVYRAMATAERTRKAMWAMLESYRNEGTVFVELRTTPRAGVRFVRDGVAEAGTAVDYVNLVLDVLDEYDAWQQSIVSTKSSSGPGFMMVKLLLSVNRRMTAEVANQVVHMVAELKQLRPTATARIVGIDFSGDCYSGEWGTYAAVLASAQQAGLKVSLHVGEKADETELTAMLASRPDRIGHLVFASAENRQRVRESKLPLELCITSNLMTTNWTVEQHHIDDWFSLKPASANTGETVDVLDTVPELVHPVSINTDDRGVFDTTLTRELELFLRAVCGKRARTAPSAGTNDPPPSSSVDVPISPEEARAVVAITRQAIRDAFVASHEERAELMDKLRLFCRGERVAALLRR
jgi:adenosine deaminase